VITGSDDFLQSFQVVAGSWLHYTSRCCTGFSHGVADVGCTCALTGRPPPLSIIIVLSQHGSR